MNRLLPLVVLPLILASAWSCHSPAYQANEHFPGEEWPRDRNIQFDFTPKQSGEYLPSVWIRHSTDYPYQDFHCLLTITQGHLCISADTLHLTLASPEGDWKGQGLQGLKTLTQPAPHGTYLDSACHYQIAIQHLMADDTLQAVKDVGIKIEQQAIHD